MDKRPRSSGHGNSRHYEPKIARRNDEEQPASFDNSDFQAFLGHRNPQYPLVPYEPTTKRQSDDTVQSFYVIETDQNVRTSIQEALKPWEGELEVPALGRGSFGIVFKYNLVSDVPFDTVLKLERTIHETRYKKSFQYKAEVDKYRCLHLSLEERYIRPEDIDSTSALATDEMEKFIAEKGISEIPVGTLLAFRNQVDCIKFTTGEPGFARVSGYVLRGFSCSLDRYMDDNFSDFYKRPEEYAQVFKESFRQVSLGLEYIHRQGYAHTDLKDGNICCEGVGQSMRFYLIDFGLIDTLPKTRLEAKDVAAGRAVQSVYESAAIRQKLKLLNTPADELESLLYMRLLDFFSLVDYIYYTPFPWYPPKDWPDLSEFENINTDRIDENLKFCLARPTDDPIADPTDKARLRRDLQTIASEIWENYLEYIDNLEDLEEDEVTATKIQFQLELGWVPALLVEIWSVSMERFSTLPDYNFIRSFIPS